MFDRSDYSYKRVEEPALRELVGQIKGSVYELRRTYNISEQHREAMELETRLRSKDPLEPYIRSKQQVTEKTLHKIKSARKDAVKEHQKQLSLFLD